MFMKQLARKPLTRMQTIKAILKGPAFSPIAEPAATRLRMGIGTGEDVRTISKRGNLEQVKTALNAVALDQNISSKATQQDLLRRFDVLARHRYSIKLATLLVSPALVIGFVSGVFFSGMVAKAVAAGMIGSSLFHIVMAKTTHLSPKAREIAESLFLDKRLPTSTRLELLDFCGLELMGEALMDDNEKIRRHAAQELYHAVESKKQDISKFIPHLLVALTDPSVKVSHRADNALGSAAANGSELDLELIKALILVKVAGDSPSDERKKYCTWMLQKILGGIRKGKIKLQQGTLKQGNPEAPEQNKRRLFRAVA